MKTCVVVVGFSNHVASLILACIFSQTGTSQRAEPRKQRTVWLWLLGPPEPSGMKVFGLSWSLLPAVSSYSGASPRCYPLSVFRFGATSPSGASGEGNQASLKKGNPSEVGPHRSPPSAASARSTQPSAGISQNISKSKVANLLLRKRASDHSCTTHIPFRSLWVLVARIYLCLH